MTEAATAEKIGQTTDSTPETPIGESVVTSLVTPEPKLWAGKYKSPEELEKAYGNAVTAIRENKELKDKLDTYTKAPEDYVTPEGLTLREHELSEIKAMAKDIGLTQEHFDKMARGMATKIQTNMSLVEQNKQALGDEKLNVLQEYVKNTYPPSLHETVMNKLIRDGGALAEAFEHRTKQLNSEVPGMSTGSTVATEQPKYDGKAELEKAANEFKKNPSESNRNRYIDTARQVAEARFKK